MSDVPHLLRLVRGSPPPDVAVLLITFLLTVFVDLVVAVNVGVILASLLFMRRMALAVNVEMQLDNSSDQLDQTVVAGNIPRGVLVYSIDGPLFFGAAEKLAKTLLNIHRPATILVLRMRLVPFVDATGIQAIEEIVGDFLKQGATVLLSETRPNVLHKLDRAGLSRRIGAANICETFPLAIERACVLKNEENLSS